MGGGARPPGLREPLLRRRTADAACAVVPMPAGPLPPSGGGGDHRRLLRLRRPRPTGHRPDPRAARRPQAQRPRLPGAVADRPAGGGERADDPAQRAARPGGDRGDRRDRHPHHRPPPRLPLGAQAVRAPLHRRLPAGGVSADPAVDPARGDQLRGPPPVGAADRRHRYAHPERHGFRHRSAAGRRVCRRRARRARARRPGTPDPAAHAGAAAQGHRARHRAGAAARPAGEAGDLARRR